MNKPSQLMFKALAIVLFSLAIASILATLFSAFGSNRSPGLLLAVALAGLGKWLFGKTQGISAQETFGRAIKVAKTDDALELRHDGEMKLEEPQRDIARRAGDVHNAEFNDSTTIPSHLSMPLRLAGHPRKRQ